MLKTSIIPTQFPLIRHTQEKRELRKLLKKLRKRIAKQRDTRRPIARVKREVFTPVTNLYHTTYQDNIECTTQRDISITYTIENKKEIFPNNENTTDTSKSH